MRKSIIGALLCLVALNVNAELISRDLYSFGDGLLTYDTDTNLEWLDYTVTEGLTLADFGSTGLSGLGFALPSESTLESFMINAGVDLPADPYLISESTKNYNAIQLLADFGFIRDDTWTSIEIYVPETDDTYDEYQFSYHLYKDAATLLGYVEHGPPTLGGIYPESSLSHSAIVRISPVPIPAAVWLFGSGLIGLIGMARRKA